MSIDVIASRIVDGDNFVKTIDRVHGSVHDGYHFTTGLSTTIVANSTYFILVTAPNTAVEPHIQFNISAQAAATIGFYSAPTAASTGVVTYTPNNNNQRSTEAATVTVKTVASSDVTSTGDYLEGYAIGANAPPVRVGGDAANRNEWILKTNTAYLFKLNSVSTNTITYNISWYENGLV